MSLPGAFLLRSPLVNEPSATRTQRDESPSGGPSAYHHYQPTSRPEAICGLASFTDYTSAIVVSKYRPLPIDAIDDCFFLPTESPERRLRTCDVLEIFEVKAFDFLA
jgi:hypothetical protein